ncbi:unnamed protein product, partial [Callosobruchus maculatus]
MTIQLTKRVMLNLMLLEVKKGRNLMTKILMIVLKMKIMIYLKRIWVSKLKEGNSKGYVVLKMRKVKVKKNMTQNRKENILQWIFSLKMREMSAPV